MSIIHRTRPQVKSARKVARPVRPFGEGVLPPSQPGLSSPIDQRPLPTIQGDGLTKAEWFRINGAMNRAKASYADSCPDADLIEIEAVGRKAAADELRRTLRDRPVAPAIVPSRPAVVQSPAIQGTRRERRMPYTATDVRWWAENSPTRNVGYDIMVPAPIRGGAPAEPDWDALADEALALARLDMGFCL